MPAILQLFIFWIGRRDVISKQERENQWRMGYLTDEQYAKTSMMARRQVKMWRDVPRYSSDVSVRLNAPAWAYHAPVAKAPPAIGFRSREFISTWK